LNFATSSGGERERDPVHLELHVARASRRPTRGDFFDRSRGITCLPLCFESTTRLPGYGAAARRVGVGTRVECACHWESGRATGTLEGQRRKRKGGEEIRPSIRGRPCRGEHMRGSSAANAWRLRVRCRHRVSCVLMGKHRHVVFVS
jgi:hypothetical protein